MPELSRFFGIVVKMFYNEHQPAHFHAQYSGSEVVINIDTLGIIRGHLPPRAMGLVMEWAAHHQEELKNEWKNAMILKPLREN